MNSLNMILRNIRNLFPYLLLIAIYFFFVNLEARNERTNKQNIEKDINLDVKKSKAEASKLRIKIPVIPYEE